MAAMISIEDARAHVLAGLSPTGAEIVALADAWGRVSAADIEARLTHPPQDVSAMDGYAVRAADADPRLVVGASPAGHPWAGQVGPGQAVRLFTGSFVPAGADSVVLQEDTDVDGERITIREGIRAGQHIRRAGQDFREGEIMVKAGSRLTPRQIGVAAAANHAWIAVRRRPVIAILATGDEIVLPGERLPEGGIVSSNSHALSALVRACGGVPMLLPIAGDTREAIVMAARDAQAADLLVTTGGASVGDHDLVASALGEMGLALNFWKVAMRPGKPLMHGHLGRLPLLGLPGNPVSAYLCAALFLKPAIERLLGLPGEAPATVPATLAAPLPANDHRADHLRCRLALENGVLIASPASRQDSAMMRILADADGIILRAPHAPVAAAGDTVQVLRLDNMGL
jgi:molybdopterin molybdotransferase